MAKLARLARNSLLKAQTDRIVVLHGGMGVKARRRADEMLASDGPRVVLATGRYIGGVVPGADVEARRAVSYAMALLIVSAARA